MQILWESNGRGKPTGYGNQTGLFTGELKRRGHGVNIAAFYGVEGNPLVDEQGINAFPHLADPFMHDMIRALFKFTQSNLLITLMDVFVLQPEIFAKMPWCAWCPEDSEPAKPGQVAVLKQARWVWAMSRFGERMFKDAGLGAKTMYVPHGVDTAAFTPENRDEARKKATNILEGEIGNRFVVMMNAANKGSPSRKGFAYVLEAFKIFSEAHKDALLVLHTDMEGFGAGGEHLPTLITQIGVNHKAVLYSKQFPYVMGMFGPNHLNVLYNSADVLINTSLGEGFGIPIVESQAAGCPVIVTDFSAMPELVFAGWKVPGTKFYTDHYVKMMIPDVREIVLALEAAYQRRNDQAFRERARAGALAYDFHRVYDEYMNPALERIALELERGKSKRQKRLERGKTLTPAPLPQGEGGKEGSKAEAAR